MKFTGLNEAMQKVESRKQKVESRKQKKFELCLYYYKTIQRKNLDPINEKSPL